MLASANRFTARRVSAATHTTRRKEAAFVAVLRVPRDLPAVASASCSCPRRPRRVVVAACLPELPPRMAGRVALNLAQVRGRAPSPCRTPTPARGRKHTAAPRRAALPDAPTRPVEERAPAVQPHRPACNRCAVRGAAPRWQRLRPRAPLPTVWHDGRRRHHPHDPPHHSSNARALQPDIPAVCVYRDPSPFPGTAGPRAARCHYGGARDARHPTPHTFLFRPVAPRLLFMQTDNYFMQQEAASHPARPCAGNS